MRRNMVLLIFGAAFGLCFAGCETRDGAALPPEFGAQHDASPPDFGSLVDNSSPDHAFLRETVTCRFTHTSELQSCLADGGGGCEGVGSCTVALLGSIYGFEKRTWHSSCGGEVATTIDGSDEAVVFDCAPNQPTTETVTCRFVGSAAPQTCSSPAGQCSGALSCSVHATANQGARLRWTSACSGYASISAATVIDGADDEVVFDCGAATVSETITCDFQGSSQEQHCFAAGYSPTPGPGACSGTGSCSTVLEGPLGMAVQWKASCDPASGESYGFSLLDGQDETIAWNCAP